mmetsp:Transcript_21087/g.81836  ORF Transcript_21087/g.81836 Transcript_21087/m.81836 type:complete len:573 (+) Transcript_21087:990-2708(+)
MPGPGGQGAQVAPGQLVGRQHQVGIGHRLGGAVGAVPGHELQPRCDPCGLMLPVEEQRGRHDDQGRTVQPPRLLLDPDMGQGLGRLAQAHVVGQDAGQPLLAQMLQPGQAVQLIGPQRQAQAGGLSEGLRRPRRQEALAEGAQAGVAVDLPAAARVVFDRAQAFGVPGVQPQRLALVELGGLEQVQQGQHHGLQGRGQRVIAPPPGRAQRDEGVILDRADGDRIEPALVAAQQIGQQGRQVQALAVHLHAQAREPGAAASLQAQAGHTTVGRARVSLGLAHIEGPAADELAVVGEARLGRDPPALGLQLGHALGMEIAEEVLLHQGPQGLAEALGAAAPLQHPGVERQQAQACQRLLGAGIATRQQGNRHLLATWPQRPAGPQAEQAVAAGQGAQGEVGGRGHHDSLAARETAAATSVALAAQGLELAAGGQGPQVFEGAGRVSAELAVGGIDRALTESHRRGAVQQPAHGAQLALAGAHEAGLHLHRHDAGAEVREMPVHAARGVSHGHVQQGHHDAAVGHAPGVQVLLGNGQPQLGLAIADGVQLKAELLDEGDVDRELHRRRVNCRARR